MHRYESMLLSATILIACAGCRDSPGKSPNSIDLGYVLCGRTSKLAYPFQLNNDTSKILHILKITKSCACKSARIDSQAIAPHQSAILTLDVDVGDVHARKSVSGVVTTDDPDAPRRVFTLTFESLPRILPQPTVLQLGLVNLPSTSEGAPPELPAGDVTVDLFGPAGVARDDAISIEAPPDLIVDRVGSPAASTLPNAVSMTRHRLRVGLKPEAGSVSGAHVRSFNVKTADGRTVSVSVCWRGEGPFTVSPARLHFGAIRPDSTPSERLLMIRAQSRPIRVKALRSEPAWLTWEDPPQAEDGLESTANQVLTIACSPREGTEPGKTIEGIAEITLEGGPNEVVLRVPWSVITLPLEQAASPSTRSITTRE